jgi:hypothetical protein
MVTGLLGIGGGFLIVPALYLLVNLPVKKAIGTALLIITINSLFSFLNSYASMEIEWLLLIKFSVGAVLGHNHRYETLPKNSRRLFKENLWMGYTRHVVLYSV